MADARRRIQERVGDDPIQVWPTTIKQLTGGRLGYVDALKIVHLSARTHDERVSVVIFSSGNVSDTRAGEEGATILVLEIVTAEDEATPAG